MDEKLDQLLAGQTLLQSSFETLSENQKSITKCVEELSSKIESTRIKLEGDVVSLNERTSDLEKSIGFVSTQFEDNNKTQEHLLRRVDMLEKINIDLNAKMTQIIRRNDVIEETADSAENQNRKHMIEIDGIPIQKEEVEDRNWCLTKAKEICDLIGVPEIKQQIDIAHRLFNKRIIVTFSSRSARNVFYLSRFKLKGKTIADLKIIKSANDKGIIWINESLTARRKRILSKTKEKLWLLVYLSDHVGYQFTRR